MYMNHLGVPTPSGVNHFGELVNLKGLPVDDSLVDVNAVYYTRLPVANLKGNDFGFTLSQYPNNCGAVLLSNAHYNLDKGINKAIDICKELGYTQLQYSATQEQPETVAALLKAGFKALDGSTFENDRTENLITIYVYNIER